MKMMVGLSRRALLCQGAVLGSAALLAACTPTPTPAPSSPAPAQPPSAASPQPHPSESPGLAPGVAPSSSPAAAAGSAGAGTVTVAITSQSMPASPWYIAEQEGYFTNLGLTVDRTVISAATVIATGVMSGDVSVAYASATPILSPATASDVVILATPAVHYPYSLMVRSTLASVQDLPGKTIAVSALNGQDDLALTAVLTANGIAANAVSRLALGGMPARLAAIQANQVDGSLFSPPYNLTVQRLGYQSLVDLFKDLPTPVAQDVIYTSRAYAQSHHADVVDVLEGFVEAIRFGKANPDATKQLLNQWVPTSDADLLQASYDAYFTDGFEADPTPQPAAIQANIETEAQARGEQSTLQPSQVIDGTYIAEALAALPAA